MADFFSKYLNALQEIAGQTESQVFLVGGTVRDHFLGNECADFDFTAKNIQSIAREFARSTQSTCVPLDKTPGRETFRVVVGKKFQF